VSNEESVNSYQAPFRCLAIRKIRTSVNS
jgi:hypothetical protein